MPKMDSIDSINQLNALPRSHLVDLWTETYKCSPPKGMRQPLMIRAIAWHFQARAQDGFSADTKRLLKAAVKRVMAELESSRTNASSSVVRGGSLIKNRRNLSIQNAPRPLPPPGARLIRDWNGRRYVVDVVEDGYIMDGKHYKSLTALSFRITGVKWSGPRFFGL
ncbi:DUF2924 domain-containing protein [Rhizobium sp. FKL33]|uniref:DUF2924 domain-containing protein n=1 Tax=Rhizobium sp. FKL33 TaxID=2562307 RepID=UPI0014854CFA|nr:DUF2924 domain-containing protein [Rhizobium sp. FKL33]